jgi:hypothetical protein
VFKSIAVAEPRVRGEAKAGLLAALQQRYELLKEAALARASAGVDQALLSAAQQISTVSVAAGTFSAPPVCFAPAVKQLPELSLAAANSSPAA